MRRQKIYQWYSKCLAHNIPRVKHHLRGHTFSNRCLIHAELCATYDLVRIHDTLEAMGHGEDGDIPTKFFA